MRPLRLMNCVLILVATALAQAAAAAAPDEIVGLWKSVKHFGPEGRGPLIIERADDGYVADMMGLTIPVRQEGRELVFELPSGQGSFRGRVEGREIVGHWRAPPNSALFIGFAHATPVRLIADGAKSWKGNVEPFDDDFTFYMLIRKEADGALSVVLRNPDRDYGTQIGAARLVREGNALKLTRENGEPLALGALDLERQSLTLAFPNRGGSYDFKRDDDESAFYPRGKNPKPYVYRQPIARNDGWPTTTLEAADIDRKGMASFIDMLLTMPMDSSKAPQVDALLIARHGKLALEEYFHGFHRDKLHETRSAAKSLTATMAGAAIQAGEPLALTTPVYKLMSGGAFPPNLDPRKQAMTLEHLLTMSSGYHCDDSDPKAPGNEETMLEQTAEPDWHRFTLALPMATVPGEKAVYCSINPNLALGMVAHATGEDPMYTFDRLLGRPLKIARYGWPLDPVGHPYGGGSVKMVPRDFMKLGQLMLNGGRWDNRQILSQEFAKRASSRLYHLDGLTYGFLWWGADKPYKNRQVYTYAAGGAGGQAVMVIPELDMVVAIYGANYSSGRAAVDIQQNMIPRYVLPAVREKGDDKNAPVVPRLDYQTPYGRSDEAGPIKQ